MAAGSVALPSVRYLLLHFIVLTVAVMACACSVFFFFWLSVAKESQKLEPVTSVFLGTNIFF